MAMVREVSRRLRENDEMAIEDLRLKAGELAAAYQRLAQEEFARREFLTSIAHELRTPLTAASGFLEMARKSMLDGESLNMALDTVSAIGPEGPARRVIVIGGADKSAGRWEEEHLRAAALACLERGLGVKETSQQLAAKSGWNRREVYQVALDLHRHGRHAPPFHTNIKEGGPGGAHDKPG